MIEVGERRLEILFITHQLKVTFVFQETGSVTQQRNILKTKYMTGNHTKYYKHRLSVWKLTDNVKFLLTSIYLQEKL